MTECTGSCVLDPGKPNPDSISWWIDKKLYCSTEKMESNCDQAVIFKYFYKFETIIEAHVLCFQNF